MKTRAFRIPVELVEDFLRGAAIQMSPLPPDTRVLRAQSDPYTCGFILIVESQSFPDLPPRGEMEIEPLSL